MTDYLYNLPNSTTLDGALVSSTNGISIFIPLLLFFFYCFVSFGGMIMQKKRTGEADAPMWLTLGGISTIMLSLPMTLIAGLINVETLSIAVAVTILSGVWLFLDRGKNEI